MENPDVKHHSCNIKTSIARVECNNYNTIGRLSYLRSNSLETIYAFDNPTFLPDGLPSSEPGRNGIPPLPNILDNQAYYDPHDFGKERDGTSYWGTVLHILLVSAGPAVFTLPKTFLNVGLPVGLIGAFFITCLYAYNIRMFVHSEYELCKRKRRPNMSYGDTVYFAFKNGPDGVRCLASYCRYLTYIIFVVLWSGANAFNLVLIGQNVQTIYTMLYNQDVDIRTAILYVIVPLLMLCWIPSLKHLVLISTIANVVNLFLIGAVVYYILQDNRTFQPSETMAVQNIPLFLGSILFYINATGIMMPLKNHMKHPKHFVSPCGVLTTSYLPISVLYAVFGAFCVQKYGTNLRQNVLMNLPNDRSIDNTIVPAFLLVLCLQFPLITYIVYDILWNNILKEKRNEITHQLLSEYILRTLIVAIILIMAFAVPNIPLFLSVSGTIGTPLDSMIFPAVVNTLVNIKKKQTRRKLNLIIFKNGLIIVFAFILIVFGLKECYRQIIDTI